MALPGGMNLLPVQPSAPQCQHPGWADASGDDANAHSTAWGKAPVPPGTAVGFCNVNMPEPETRSPGGQNMLNQLHQNCIHESVGVVRSSEGENMILGRFTLAMFLMTAPAVWAQFSKADMVKLATDRCDTAAKTLNLSPDQLSAIKPLIQSKYVDIGQVKDVYMSSDKSDASKKTAKDSLRAIDVRYNNQINAILTPEQAKLWKGLQKDWRNDVIVPKS